MQWNTFVYRWFWKKLIIDFNYFNVKKLRKCRGAKRCAICFKPEVFVTKKIHRSEYSSFFFVSKCSSRKRPFDSSNLRTYYFLLQSKKFSEAFSSFKYSMGWPDNRNLMVILRKCVVTFESLFGYITTFYAFWFLVRAIYPDYARALVCIVQNEIVDLYIVKLRA